tara:strand:- start:2096 stop:2272 length:177 start_codon:yes stop_codon:yes gene_type:complete
VWQRGGKMLAIGWQLIDCVKIKMVEEKRKFPAMSENAKGLWHTVPFIVLLHTVPLSLI